jgi:ABC-type dipeptide/oligopeptide/nickel transport system permease component
MGRYLLIRIGGVIGVVLGVSLITFFLMHAVPGDPFSIQAMNHSQMLTPDVKASLLRVYGLDKPVWFQYVIYMRNVFWGPNLWPPHPLSFGDSFVSSNRTVLQILVDQWPYSLELGLYTAIFSGIIGLGLGIGAAIKQGTWIDFLGTATSLFCLAMPSFVFALMLQLFFAIKLGWVAIGGVNLNIFVQPAQWILPTIANSLGPVLILQRFTKGSVLDVVRANYVRTARSKGLKEWRITFIHIFKNSLSPVLTVAGPMVAGLISGSFFIESIFRIPGVGYYFVSAVQNRDYSLIMATTMIWTMLITVTYLITDLLYAALDPRVTFTKEK